MSAKNGYARWTHAARYGDLWKLLKRLGYDCGWLGTNPLGGDTVRICKHSSSKSRITLADEPAEQFVEPHCCSACACNWTTSASCLPRRSTAGRHGGRR